MTHGETRGTLLLLLLMAAVILISYLCKDTPHGQRPPQSGSGLSPTPAQIDSMRMEESASRYDSAPGSTSTRRAGKPERKSSKGTSRPAPANSPSPLDRPV